jgi:hypothetical protein
MVYFRILHLPNPSLNIAAWGNPLGIYSLYFCDFSFLSYCSTQFIIPHETCFYSFQFTVPWHSKASGCKRAGTPVLDPSSHLDHIRFGGANDTFLTYNDSVLCCLKVSHSNIREAAPDGIHLVTSGVMWLHVNSHCGYTFHFTPTYEETEQQNIITSVIFSVPPRRYQNIPASCVRPHGEVVVLRPGRSPCQYHNILWRVYGCVTNNKGFWIGYFDLLITPLQSLVITINYNNSQ